MSDVLIIAAKRTPFGSFGGSLSSVPAPQLAAQVTAKVLTESGLPPEAVDEYILGQVLQGGTGQAPARQAMRLAGIPDSTHAMTINKVCGSGLKSIMLAADAIRLGDAAIAIAGGMENMSLAPYLLPSARFGQRMGPGKMLDLMLVDGLLDPDSGEHMGDITERWIARHQVSRQDQDAYAARSYRLAQAALAENTFADELVTVTVKTRKGDVVVDQDEEPGKGDIDRLPGLRPVFAKDGSITAGNASSINDGAALALVAGEAAVKQHGLTPIARLVASATHSISPGDFAEAPVEAIRKVTAKAGLRLQDIDLFEINEAFAAVPLVAIRQLQLDPDKVNINGGAVAIGHPIGASGGRLAATLIRELRSRRARYGVAALCIGGGEAVAALFERI
ncbi:MAG: thiolase family protein [Desulfuromonadales bacterium]|jgi:acetyl-CoA C-acetyltransferase